MKKQLLSLSFLLLFLQAGSILSAFSQNPSLHTLQGNICESSEEKELPVPGANIQLLNPSDSSIIVRTVSDKKGDFVFSQVKESDYLLSVTSLGYSPAFRNISKEQLHEKSINLGKIRMKISSVMLDQVTVTAIPPEVVIKEDTVEYNTGAFKMQENAVAEDLLKRLPGVEVDPNGNIKMAGKEIKQVLVDGKEFFGNDLKMATQNIQVKIIDKIQVIDKKTEEATRTGIEDGKKETVINLSIKKGMNRGWIGNASVGGGALTDNPANEPARYAANAMLSRFQEGDNISFILNSGNVNSGSTFFPGDMSNFSGTGSSLGRQGISNSSFTGINIFQSEEKKYKASGSISYNYSDMLSENKKFRQNILVDSVSYTESFSKNHNYSNNIQFNTNLEYQPDTLNTFSLVGNIFYNNSSSRNQSYQSTMAGDPDSTRVNASESQNSNYLNGWNMMVNMTYSRKFSKKGRRFSLSGDFALNTSDGNGNNASLSEFFLQPDRNQRLDQQAENNSLQNSYGIKAAYIEPVWGEKNVLQFSYSINNNQTTNIRETYNYDTESGTYSILNPDYSKSLDNKYINQRAGVSFNSNQEKYYYNIGMSIIPSYTQSTSYIKDGSSTGNDSILNNIDGRSVINYSPQANFRYRFSNKSNLTFNYSGNTRQPDVSQLDPTPDNTNPLYIRSGNPDLLPSFSNSIFIGYNSYQQEKQQSFDAGMRFSFTQNEIISFTDYEESTGIQYSRPINQNGSWNTSGNIMFNRPLDKKKRLRFNTNTSLSYNNRVGYMMVNKKSEKNISGSMNLGENVGLTYSKDKFYGQLRGNINYSHTTNSLEDKKNLNSTSFGVSYYTTVSLPRNWELSSDINYRENRGLSAGYNTDEVLWNMNISKRLLKKKQAAISFRWNDILRQRVNISRNVTASYIEDNEYNSLTGYFLVSFSYQLNQMGRN